MAESLLNLLQSLLILANRLLILASFYWGRIIIALLIWNIIVFLIYGRDKVLAENGEWRIPEQKLLRYAFWFGSFGALIGCRIFRHKVSKTSFFGALQRIAGLHIFGIIGLAYYYARTPVT